MKTTNNTAAEMTNITLFGVEKETEKAMLISTLVRWNGDTHQKSFWFPKSVIGEVIAGTDEKNVGSVDVKTWFLNKLGKDNAFKGYHMYFE